MCSVWEIFKLLPLHIKGQHHAHMGGPDGGNCPRYPINSGLIANSCHLANITKPQDTWKEVEAEKTVVHNIN